MASNAPELAVVVRYTHYSDVEPRLCVDLMRAFADRQEADAEASRLNAVGREGTEYFVKTLTITS